jgi:hypothetical protein
MTLRRRHRERLMALDLAMISWIKHQNTRNKSKN